MANDEFDILQLLIGDVEIFDFTGAKKVKKILSYMNF